MSISPDYACLNHGNGHEEEKYHLSKLISAHHKSAVVHARQIVAKIMRTPNVLQDALGWLKAVKIKSGPGRDTSVNCPTGLWVLNIQREKQSAQKEGHTELMGLLNYHRSPDQEIGGRVRIQTISRTSSDER